jgi:CubicO group peptidase (beta-lactamase class C family)
MAREGCVNRLHRAVAAGFALACAAAVLARGQPASDAHSDDSLIGVWSYETAFGDLLRGELSIVRRPGKWRATAGNQSVEFSPDGERIRFEFPGGRGRFRGRLVEDAIRGFWIRPAVTKDPRYPGGSSQAFATPMTLALTGEHTWLGVLRPLPDPFTLYLSIFRDGQGALMGAFRNPEQNSHGPAMQYRVARDGNELRFMAGSDPATTETAYVARLLPNPERLRIEWEDAGGEILLTRRTPAQAAAYFPRPPGGAAYSYEEPTIANDGWETARASEVGIDEAAVERMVKEITGDKPSGRRPSLIHSLLVAKDGKLIVEEYFFGYERDEPHDLRSAGKTFASVLLGAVMREGVPLDPGKKIYELMKGRGPFANPDPRKADITLAQLLTHSAGLACDDYDDASPGNESTMQTQDEQPDWWKYTLDLPMAHDPGTRYAYCSANINLVGGALTTWTKTWLPELFDEEVARPLQFGEWHWNLMPNDEGYLGGGAFLRPRDLLKVGQVYLDGGAWKGRQIVDAAWIRQSTEPRMKITQETTGLTADEFAEGYSEGADALAWHMNPVRAGDKVIDAYAATGNGGQVLVVIPSLEMTVVFTGGNYLQGGIWSRWTDRLIGGHLIGAGS